MKNIKNFENFVNEEIDFFGKKSKLKSEEKKDDYIFDKIVSKIKNNFDPSNITVSKNIGIRTPYYLPGQYHYNTGDEKITIEVQWSLDEELSSAVFLIDGVKMDTDYYKTKRFAQFLIDEYKKYIGPEKARDFVK